MAKRSRRKNRRNPADSLTDDLIVEILSRLPVKSLCRFKCVSRHWHGLISDPDHRRRLPQTLAGLFYSIREPGRSLRRHFTNLWEIGRPPLVCPLLSFVSGHENLIILDSCNGLLLCRRSETAADSETESETETDISSPKSCYLVCNPATESWVVLPYSGSGDSSSMVRLGFDHAVSRHFHVFEFVHNGWSVAGVNIYSSGTGAWSYMESGWDPETCIFKHDRSVFYNGLLLIVDGECVLTVDVEGKTWRMLALPDAVDHIDCEPEPGFVGRYQGHLCYINECYEENMLSIWVCEDYAAEKWILKHQVSVQRLTENVNTNYLCEVITIHPDCNWILYVYGEDKTLRAYDVDCEECHVIQDLGPALMPYIPYVPFYSGSLTNGH